MFEYSLDGNVIQQFEFNVQVILMIITSDPIENNVHKVMIECNRIPVALL